MLDTLIHPTAVVDASAELSADVTIGPYAVIGPNVRIGAGTSIGPHAYLVRDTIIGENCVIHHGAALGGDPQDLKYGSEATELIIGDRTVIREFASLNRGTSALGRTQVGNDCLIMAYAHVAHDCVIGDRVILANSVQMGGHVLIEDWVVVGGLSGIHQFTRIGAHAFVGANSMLRKDLPPYVLAVGNPAKLYGLNSIGLERRGFSEETRMALKRAYRLLFRSKLNVNEAVQQVRETLPDSPEVRHLLAFVAASERGVMV